MAWGSLRVPASSLRCPLARPPRQPPTRRRPAGNRSASALLGLQLEEEEMAEFWEAGDSGRLVNCGRRQQLIIDH